MASKQFYFSKQVASVKKLFHRYRKFFLSVAIMLIVVFFIVDVYLFLNRQVVNASPVICTKTPLPKSSITIDPKIKEFGLKIEKIDILVPIVKDVDGKNKTAYNNALKEGVAHFKGTALPGDGGNIFIFGHSSAEYKSDYSKVFVKLNDLEKDDEIAIFYLGNEHKYKVTGKDIVEAMDLSVLNKGKKEMLTLMTCWPIGTKEKRLIIRAEPK